MTFCSIKLPYIVHVAALLTAKTVYVFSGVCTVSLISVKK